MNRPVFILLILLAFPAYGGALESLTQSGSKIPLIIDAEDFVECDEEAGHCIASGQAKAQKGTSIVYGDRLTVYFTKNRDITEVMADGNVRMETPTETAYGDHAHYDLALDRVRVTGHTLRLVTPKEIVTAEESLEYWHKEKKGIAKGNALAQFPDTQDLIQAHTLFVYFESSSQGEQNMAVQRIEAEGNVFASSPKGIVVGDRGTYVAKTGRIDIFGNVRILQGDNLIRGGYGKANLKTNVMEIFPTDPRKTPCGCRESVSGIILPKNLEKGKNISPLKKPQRRLRNFKSAVKSHI